MECKKYRKDPDAERLVRRPWAPAPNRHWTAFRKMDRAAVITAVRKMLGAGRNFYDRQILAVCDALESKKKSDYERILREYAVEIGRLDEILMFLVEVSFMLERQNGAEQS